MGDWRQVYLEAQARGRAQRAAAVQPIQQQTPPSDGSAWDTWGQQYESSSTPTAGEELQDFASGAVGGVLGLPADIGYGIGQVVGSDTLREKAAKMSAWAQNVVPPSNPQRPTLGGEVGQFVGGALPFLAVGAPELESLPAWASSEARMAALGGAQGFGAGAREANQAGASPWEAWGAGLGQAAIGAAQAIPAEKILSAASKPFLESAAGVLGTGAAYGGAAQAAGNLVKKATYAPETDISQGVGEQALAGGLGMGLVHAGVHALVPTPGKRGASGLGDVMPEAEGFTPPEQKVPTDWAGLDPHIQRGWNSVAKDMGGSQEVQFIQPQTPREAGAQELLAPRGTDVQLVESTDGKPLPEQGAFYTDPESGRSVIFMDRNAPGFEGDLGKATLWHEVLHQMQTQDPTKFEALWNTLKGIDETLPEEKQMRSVVADRLGIKPDAVTPELLKQEGANYKAEQLAGLLDQHLTDPDQLQALLTSKPAPVLRVLDGILKMAQEVGLAKDWRLFSEKHTENVLKSIGLIADSKGKIDVKQAVEQSGAIAKSLREFLSGPLQIPEHATPDLVPAAGEAVPIPKTEPLKPPPAPKPVAEKAPAAPVEPQHVADMPGRPVFVSKKGERFTVTGTEVGGKSRIRLEGEDGEVIWRSKKQFEKEFVPEGAKAPAPEQKPAAKAEPSAEDVAEAMQGPSPEEAAPEMDHEQLVQAAKELLTKTKRMSAGFVQRSLNIGYERAKRVFEDARAEMANPEKKGASAQEVAQESTSPEQKPSPEEQAQQGAQRPSEESVPAGPGRDIFEKRDSEHLTPSVLIRIREALKVRFSDIAPESDAFKHVQGLVEKVISHVLENKGRMISVSEIADSLNWTPTDEPIPPERVRQILTNILPALHDAGKGFLTFGKTTDGEVHIGTLKSKFPEGMARERSGRANTAKQRIAVEKRKQEAAGIERTPEQEAEEQRVDTQMTRFDVLTERVGLTKGKKTSAEKRAALDLLRQEAEAFIRSKRGDLKDWLLEKPLFSAAFFDAMQTHDEAHDGPLLFSKARESYKGDKYEMFEELRREALHRMFVDQYSYVRRARRQVLDTLSPEDREAAQRDDASNFDRAITLSPGRTRERLDGLKKQWMDPLVEHLKENGISLDEANKYLYYLHAPARNEALMQRDLAEQRARIISEAKRKSIAPDFTKVKQNYDHETHPASGIATSEAKANAAEIESGQKAAEYRKIRDWNREFQQNRIDMAIEYGFLNEHQAAKLKKRFGEDYVPLRTLGDRNPRGFAIKAKGRETEAEAMLEHSYKQAIDTVIYGETNKVRRAAANFFSEHPDEKLWQVFTRDSSVPKALRKNTAVYWNHGRKRFLTFADPNMAASLLRMGTYRTDLVTRTIGRWSQWYARMNTTWNPEFLLPNLTRDVLESKLNLSSERKAQFAKGLPRDIRAAVKAIWRVRGDENAKGEWEAHAKEFAKQGGETGFARMQDIGEISQQMLKDLDTAKHKPYSAKGSWALLMKAKDFIERASDSVENGTRLVVYKHALDAGKSPAEAAEIAKTVTVDFNRRGDWSPLMNALYTFFNANVQSTARIFGDFHKNKTKQAFAAAIVASGIASSALNRYLLSDVDDDGVSFWDKKSPWEKSRELILMVPGMKGRSINIPMPWGWSIFQALGTNIDSVIHGKSSPGRFTTAAWAAAADAFNPMGNTPTVAQFFTPTLFDPIVQIAENVDFAGRPVAPPKDPFEHPQKPNSERFFSTVSPAALAGARFLNRMTGGDMLQSGVVDVSPEWIELMGNQVMGGVGKSLTEFGKTIENTTQGTFNLNDMPILRRFSRGLEPERQIKTDYFQNVEDVTLAEARVKELGDEDAKNSPAYASRFEYGIAERRIMALKKQLKAVGEDGDPEKRARLNEQIIATMKKFNTAMQR